MTTPSFDLNDIARRYREATQRSSNASAGAVGAVINREGRLVPEGGSSPAETSKIPTTPFAAAPATASAESRLQRDRAVVRSKFPPGTKERKLDSWGTTAWFYKIDNELGCVFEFATFFDGAQYQSILVRPEGLERHITEKFGGHRPHMFSDGYICLGRNGGGAASLEDAWAKTAMWAYHMAAFLNTGQWLFLNR